MNDTTNLSKLCFEGLALLAALNYRLNFRQTLYLERHSLFPKVNAHIPLFQFLTSVTLTTCRWVKCIHFALFPKLYTVLTVYLSNLLFLYVEIILPLRVALQWSLLWWCWTPYWSFLPLNVELPLRILICSSSVCLNVIYLLWVVKWGIEL